MGIRLARFIADYEMLVTAVLQAAGKRPHPRSERQATEEYRFACSTEDGLE